MIIIIHRSHSIAAFLAMSKTTVRMLIYKRVSPSLFVGSGLETGLGNACRLGVGYGWVRVAGETIYIVIMRFCIELLIYYALGLH